MTNNIICKSKYNDNLREIIIDINTIIKVKPYLYRFINKNNNYEYYFFELLNFEHKTKSKLNNNYQIYKIIKNSVVLIHVDKEYLKEFFSNTYFNFNDNFKSINDNEYISFNQFEFKYYSGQDINEGIILDYKYAKLVENYNDNISLIGKCFNLFYKKLNKNKNFCNLNVNYIEISYYDILNYNNYIEAECLESDKYSNSSFNSFSDNNFLNIEETCKNEILDNSFKEDSSNKYYLINNYSVDYTNKNTVNYISYNKYFYLISKNLNVIKNTCYIDFVKEINKIENSSKENTLTNFKCYKLLKLGNYLVAFY